MLRGTGLSPFIKKVLCSRRSLQLKPVLLPLEARYVRRLLDSNQSSTFRSLTTWTSPEGIQLYTDFPSSSAATGNELYTPVLLNQLKIEHTLAIVCSNKWCRNAVREVLSVEVDPFVVKRPADNCGRRLVVNQG